MTILPPLRTQRAQKPLTRKTVAKVLAAATLAGTAIGGAWTFVETKISRDNQGADVAKGIACMSTQASAAQFLQSHYPEVGQTLSVMQALPLTGDEVARHVGSLSGLYVCRSERKDSLGYYNAARATIGIRKDAGVNVVAHEYFHAHQAIMAFKLAVNVQLTTRDTAFADMLGEATAAAYELVLEKEAQILGVEYQASGNTTAQGGKLRHVFNEAYSAFRDYAPSDTQENLQRALEYAGRRVVVSLMKGEDREWASNYADLAITNTKKMKVVAQGCDAQYRRDREAYFKSQGYVTREFNLVPVAYIGDDADTYIKRDFSVHMTLSNKNALNNGCAAPPPPPAV